MDLNIGRWDLDGLVVYHFIALWHHDITKIPERKVLVPLTLGRNRGYWG
jgi:hypothetical protein